MASNQTEVMRTASTVGVAKGKGKVCIRAKWPIMAGAHVRFQQHETPRSVSTPPG